MTEELGPALKRSSRSKTPPRSHLAASVLGGAGRPGAVSAAQFQGMPKRKGGGQLVWRKGAVGQRARFMSSRRREKAKLMWLTPSIWDGLLRSRKMSMTNTW